ncbi:helix-turn-helix transcriptional regulator [Deinococcus radiophilus]|uniref:PadR family transcriptional regulator n=1 Tax=Deinococcus radiophilus TaxID=32062 RepID=A0A3S0I7A7_9DEIO|nr:helix-turn-helix transcriptional regulator [Deinococcus radiophilus]RTR26835.1 PadR family transcriptional regulator [Deinococcus radiophilus]UFA51800.1 helix-turn-helix transcriptional regulator [Deinococcus radiophilus]
MNQKEQLRLLILAVLGRQPEHGYAIAQAIKLRSEGVLSAREGSLYPTLHLLEKEGLVQSSEVEASGRVRREYRITEQGREALQSATGTWEHQVRAVGAVLGSAS